MERDGRKVYFGGDSGYFKGYRVFGGRYPGIDVALLGVGAYAPGPGAGAGRGGRPLAARAAAHPAGRRPALPRLTRFRAGRGGLISAAGAETMTQKHALRRARGTTAWERS